MAVTLYRQHGKGKAWRYPKVNLARGRPLTPETLCSASVSRFAPHSRQDRIPDRAVKLHSVSLEFLRSVRYAISSVPNQVVNIKFPNRPAFWQA